MKILPNTKREWLSLLSAPFKIFIFAYGIIFPLWLFSAPGTPGTIRGPDYTVIEYLGVGYLFTFFALLGIGVVQFKTKNRRDAVWSVAFSILALFLAMSGINHPYVR